MQVAASVFASELRAVAESAADARLRVSVALHARAVWRVLRRNGVPEADADDGVQKVFLVLARRLQEVAPERELGFLLRTATFVASESRRTQRRRHEADGPILDIHESKELAPDDAVAQRQAIARLDAVLDTMDESLRSVFVLFELEEMTMAAIAESLELPMGTVASRLRRARARFEELCSGGPS